MAFKITQLAQGVSLRSPASAVVGHKITATVFLGSDDFSVASSKFILVEAAGLSATTAKDAEGHPIIPKIVDGVNADGDKTLQIDLPVGLPFGDYELRLAIKDAANDNNVFYCSQNINVLSLEQQPEDDIKEIYRLVLIEIKRRVVGGIDSGVAESFGSEGLTMAKASLEQLQELKMSLETQLAMRDNGYERYQVDIQNSPSI